MTNAPGSKKRILVSQVFHPDEESTSQLLSALFAAWSMRDQYSCEVLAGFPADESLQGSRERQETWNDIRILRGGFAVAYKKSLLMRAIGYAAYCVWLCWRLIFRVPANSTVLVVTNPPFAPVLTYLCSRVRGWSYAVILHDVYPDGLVALGKMRSDSVLTRLWRRANRRTLRAAKGVVVLGRDMASLCQERYHVEAERINCIPNWSPVDFSTTTVAESTRLWSRLGYTNEFVVQYSGNMGLWHDIDTLVEAARILRDDARIRFLMIGRGRRRDTAEARSRKLGLNNMVWLPYQPKDELTDSLSCCHAALLSQRSGLEGVAVPCKLYGILASGRMVLAQVPPQSEAGRVVREDECGIVIPTGDAAALAQVIVGLARDRLEVTRLSVNARHAYEQKYTLRHAVELFGAFLSKIDA